MSSRSWRRRRSGLYDRETHSLRFREEREGRTRRRLHGPHEGAQIAGYGTGIF
jgi:hypothetical protein